jgi:hypothetical protein
MPPCAPERVGACTCGGWLGAGFAAADGEAMRRHQLGVTQPRGVPPRPARRPTSSARLIASLAACWARIWRAATGAALAPAGRRAGRELAVRAVQTVRRWWASGAGCWCNAELKASGRRHGAQQCSCSCSCSCGCTTTHSRRTCRQAGVDVQRVDRRRQRRGAQRRAQAQHRQRAGADGRRARRRHCVLCAFREVVGQAVAHQQLHLRCVACGVTGVWHVVCGVCCVLVWCQVHGRCWHRRRPQPQLGARTWCCSVARSSGRSRCGAMGRTAGTVSSLSAGTTSHAAPRRSTLRAAAAGTPASQAPSRPAWLAARRAASPAARGQLSCGRSWVAAWWRTNSRQAGT